MIAKPSTNFFFSKTKKRSDGNGATYFPGLDIPEVGSDCTCFTVILLDFVLKRDTNYSLQVFLKECKCNEKEKKVIRYISDDLEVSPEDSDKLYE